LRLDRLQAIRWLDAEDASPAMVEVAGDVAHVLIGHEHGDVHDRFDTFEDQHFLFHMGVFNPAAIDDVDSEEPRRATAR
jgi:hypothetical protein